MGDLSQIIPCIQPTVGGYCGTLHSDEFHAVDKNAAYIVPAKIIALTAARLLKNNAEAGKEIKKKFNRIMNKDEYINYLENV